MKSILFFVCFCMLMIFSCANSVKNTTIQDTIIVSDIDSFEVEGIITTAISFDTIDSVCN